MDLAGEWAVGVAWVGVWTIHRHRLDSDWAGYAYGADLFDRWVESEYADLTAVVSWWYSLVDAGSAAIVDYGTADVADWPDTDVECVSCMGAV